MLVTFLAGLNQSRVTEAVDSVDWVLLVKVFVLHRHAAIEDASRLVCGGTVFGWRRSRRATLLEIVCEAKKIARKTMTTTTTTTTVVVAAVAANVSFWAASKRTWTRTSWSADCLETNMVSFLDFHQLYPLLRIKNQVTLLTSWIYCSKQLPKRSVPQVPLGGHHRMLLLSHDPLQFFFQTARKRKIDIINNDGIINESLLCGSLTTIDGFVASRTLSQVC